MTTDNRTIEVIVAEAFAQVHHDDARRKYSVAEVKQIVYPLIDAIREAGRLAGEPTEAQVEAAAKALRDDHANREQYYEVPEWVNTRHSAKELYRARARASLVAAAGVAPQAESVGCNICGRPIPDAEPHVCSASDAPVRQVSESDLLEIIEGEMEYPHPREAPAIAKAIFKALGGESRDE